MNIAAHLQLPVRVGVPSRGEIEVHNDTTNAFLLQVSPLIIVELGSLLSLDLRARVCRLFG